MRARDSQNARKSSETLALGGLGFSTAVGGAKVLALAPGTGLVLGGTGGGGFFFGGTGGAGPRGFVNGARPGEVGEAAPAAAAADGALDVSGGESGVVEEVEVGEAGAPAGAGGGSKSKSCLRANEGKRRGG
jgi:hypothetical protein